MQIGLWTDKKKHEGKVGRKKEVCEKVEEGSNIWWRGSEETSPKL